MDSYTPIRVLQILNHMDYGGIEAVVMNYYRHMDRNKVQFDFAVSKDSLLPQKEEIQKLGGNIYLLPPVSNIVQYICDLKQIIEKNHYKIVHCHMNSLSVFPLYAAYRAGAEVRICHNHTTAHHGEGKKTVAKYLLRPCCKWFATDYFACGEYAGRWMYGDRCFDDGKVYVMRNAIDIEKFRYNPITRIVIRQRLGLTDKFVVGHIGRFMYQKNHGFLIDVFNEIHQKNADAVLLLVGEGELEGQIREKVRRLGLEDYVIFYGTSEDTSKLYQAMDVFCLPSFYEGLPVVAVEAQCNGLPVIASDEITAEVGILESYEKISLQMPMNLWTEKILGVCLDENRRNRECLLVENAGFSIRTEAERLLQHYSKKQNSKD